MSEENISDSSDETRRSFMKKGAAATVGTVAASGMASAQLDGGNETTTTPTDGGTTGGTGGETWEALLPASSFYPNAQFAVVSDTIESVPSYGDLQNVLTDYNMRLIRWQNTGEIAPLFVSQDVDVGQFDQDLGFVTAGGAGGTETPIEGGNETTTTTEEEDGALVGDNETTTEGGLGANDTGGNETGNDTGGLGGNETTTTTEGGGALFDISTLQAGGGQTQPLLFEVTDWSKAQESDQLVNVTVSQVPESEATSTLENDNWWQTEGGTTGGNETTTTTEEEDGALVGDNETTTEGGLGANDTGDNETGINDTGGLGGNETGNDTGGLGGNETTTTTEGGGGLFGGLL